MTRSEKINIKAQIMEMMGHTAGQWYNPKGILHLLGAPETRRNQRAVCNLLDEFHLQSSGWLKRRVVKGDVWYKIRDDLCKFSDHLTPMRVFDGEKKKYL